MTNGSHTPKLVHTQNFESSFETACEIQIPVASIIIHPLLETCPTLVTIYVSLLTALIIQIELSRLFGLFSSPGGLLETVYCSSHLFHMLSPNFKFADDKADGMGRRPSGTE